MSNTNLTVADMNEIIDHLHLGSKSSVSAANVECLKANNITHILTVNNCPLNKRISSEFKYKFVPGLDIEDTDLLTYFEECIAFIEEGIQAGGILVHCIAGCSRSATMVIAYLMYKSKRGYGETLGFVRKRRSCVCPNDGFKEQLLLFEDMGCTIDNTNEKYRIYKLQKLALRMLNTAGEEGELLAGHLQDNPESSSKNDTIYKCRKCRKPLFKHSGFIKHTVGAGNAAFGWRGKVPSNQREPTNVLDDSREEVCDRSIFIEPVKWMEEMIQVPEGKIFCPKCQAKIGSFIWYGERCPCGAWVAPAFHFQTGKVDECKPVVFPVQRTVTSTADVLKS